MKGGFLLAGVVMLAAVAALIAAEPSWWAGAGIGNGEAANHAPANLGQAKFMAKKAREHLNFTLDDFGGAGPEIDALVDGFASGPENYSPILAGQLKYVAKPFYDRLLAVGFDTRLSLQEHGAMEDGIAWPHNYPWNPATPTSENYSPVLLGQLKLVFSFDLNVNADADALPDWWEWGIINASQADGDPNNNLVAPAGVLATGDFDGDGLDNAREFALHTDATDRSSGPGAVLLGRWDFDERSGTVAADGSGHNHPAALTQTYYWRTEPGARSFLRLPDAGGFARIDAPDLLPGANDGDFSVAFWIRLQEAATGNWRVIMQKGDSLWERTFSMWLMQGNNHVYYRISGASNPDMGSQSASELEVGEWAHVAYVKEGRTLRLYLNGVEDSNVALPEGSVANDGPIYIGKDPWYDAARADFDDFLIYNVALRPGEVASLLTGGKWDSDHDGLSDHQEQALGTDPRSGDTDFDGVSDAREGADGTDPLDPVSVTPRRIAHFAFDEADWRSAEGQMPVEATGVVRVSDGLLYDAMRIDDNGQVMRYDWQRAGDGAPNVSLRRGTIRLWFKPDWSGSTMTGTWSRLLELGRYRGEADRAFFALHLAPNQPTITLATHDGAGHAAYSVFPFSAAAVTAGQWHQVVVTYSPTQRAVWLDGALLGTQAAAWPYAPRAADLIEDGLRLGNDWFVSQPIYAALDEVECFNYELDAATIAADYAAQSYWLVDSDTDGYRDWWEIAEHGSIADFPPTGGLPSGWAGLDEDLDGISNGDEARRGTRTNKKDSDEDGIPDADERSAGTDPNDSDEDGNGSPDGADDWDEDALSNAIEAEIGTRFRVPVADADTDGDGLNDGEEAVPIPGGEDMQVPAAPDTRYALIEIGSVEEYGIPVGINDAGKVLLVKTLPGWSVEGRVWENGEITFLGVANKFIGPLNDADGTVYKVALPEDLGDYSPIYRLEGGNATIPYSYEGGSTVPTYIPGTLDLHFLAVTSVVSGWVSNTQGHGSFSVGAINDNHQFTYHASKYSFDYEGGRGLEGELFTQTWWRSDTIGIVSVDANAALGAQYSYSSYWSYETVGYGSGELEIDVIDSDSGNLGPTPVMDSIREINNQGALTASDFNSEGEYRAYLIEKAGATPREIPNADDVTGLTDSDLGKGEGPYFITSNESGLKLTCYNKGSFMSIDKNIKTLPSSGGDVSGRAISKNLVMAMGDKIWRNCRLLDLATLCGNPEGWSDYNATLLSPNNALFAGTTKKNGAAKITVIPPVQVKVVDRDDPKKKWGEEKDLAKEKPIYAGESCGDMVSFKIGGTDGWSSTTFTWTAEGPNDETITGPTGAGKNEWKIADGDDDTAHDWVDWKPGKWKIKVQMGAKLVEFEQEVGVRSHDVLVIGWIDNSKVTLDTSNVHEDVLVYFRPDGQFFHSFARLEAAAILSQIAGGDLSGPDNGQPLTAQERKYLLNWLFKYDGNTAPPDAFNNEDEIAAYVDVNSRTNYKLLNRFQVKYLVDDEEKFVGNPTLIKGSDGQERIAAEIGTTLNHVSLGLHPGVAGPNNGVLIYDNAGEKIDFINDGRPDDIGIATINALVSPKKWSNIGSRIRFTPDDPTGYKVDVQIYPTYVIYEKGADGKFERVDTVEQAPEPIDNFNENPYPNGPAPFIDD